MSKQTSIPNYFGKRKRAGIDDVKARAKKLFLDTEGVPKPVMINDGVKINQRQESGTKVSRTATIKAFMKEKDVSKKDEKKEKSNEKEEKPESSVKESRKSDSEDGASSSSSNSTDDLIKSANELVNKMKETQKKIQGKSPTKELSLKEIKDKLKQSSRLNELKKSISKINQQAAELMELDKKKKEMIMPKIKKFDSIEVDVPKSPHKGPLYSPVKPERSPVKPAYQRYASHSDVSSLPLPFNFQKLYELFEAADTVCSMMMNRKETVTFNKLKEAVQEMTRKNFTTRHLGQIATVLPNAYSFQQEKVRNFGSTSKQDRYELVIKPDIPKCNQNKPAGNFVIYETDQMSMTPKLMKARKEAFHRALMERTKDCHEEFLKSLDPPITLNRDELKRWHPNFMVDHVPDIIPQEMPQPPNSDRPATAKDVLERAREFLSSNSRLQKALEAAAEEPKASTPAPPTPEISAEIKEKVDAKIKDPLKGISKSLLEKIRAKQAAKALDMMRMTPQQEKEVIMYSRLPDMARIVRTLFVNEQKAVLAWETIVDKVQFSYNRNLSTADIESHVKLLVKHLPEWLEIIKLREVDYLKMNRKVDLAPVMEKLQKIVTEKK